MNKYVMQLMEFVISKNRDGFHTFIDFYGHVDSIYIRVHKIGWYDGSDADLSEHIPLSKLNAAFLKSIISKITKLEDLSNQLMADNELRKKEEIKTLEKRLSELKGA